jgi:hypothetical protein
VREIDGIDRNEAGPNSLLNRCIALHNAGQIDLLGLVGTPHFTALPTHAFFTLQHFFCEAIPKLETPAAPLMHAVKALVEKAGNDLAANLPNAAFRSWCVADLVRAKTVVDAAEQGDALSMQFLTFALDALENVTLARSIVAKYTDERRLSGLFALGRIKSVDAKEADDSIGILLTFVDARQDDVTRCNALMSVFEICGQFPQLAPISVPKVIAAAVVMPGPLVQLNLVRALWLHSKLIDRMSVATTLQALKAIDPTKAGIVHELDNALNTLLETPAGDFALDFLTDILSLDGSGFNLKQFKSVKHHLATGDRERLFKLLVRWLLTGNQQLCSSLPEILTGAERAIPFDTSTVSLRLTGLDHVFLAYKVVGYLFTKPVVAASILVASLRGCDKATAVTVGELLFDPLLINYGGEARDYLKTIKRGDTAYKSVKKALRKADAYLKGLDIKEPIKELRSSEYQRNVERVRAYDMMRKAQKEAEKLSVFMSLVHRSTLLYGRKSITFVLGPNNKREAVTMDLQTISASFELPRMEIVDPVGLSVMLLAFRSAKRK